MLYKERSGGGCLDVSDESGLMSDEWLVRGDS